MTELTFIKRYRIYREQIHIVLENINEYISILSKVPIDT